jgi:arylesterase/paraoxonase
MGYFKKLFWVVVVIFASVGVPLLREAAEWTGVLLGTVTLNNACSSIGHGVVEGCEDASLHRSSGNIFFACAESLRKRRAFWPPILRNNNSIAHYGHIFILHTETNVFTKLKFHKQNFEFSSHGLGIMENPNDKNIIWIAAVNHKMSGSVIERFEYTLGSDSLVHLKTISDQNLLRNPNDVLPVGKVTSSI